MQPTILADIDHSVAVAREEVFGPVLGVMPFDDEDAVIALANDNRYGLAASLWTNDLGKAMNLVPRIEAGTVWVSAHVLLDPAMPFGGVKQSRHGPRVQACGDRGVYRVEIGVYCARLSDLQRPLQWGPLKLTD